MFCKNGFLPNASTFLLMHEEHSSRPTSFSNAWKAHSFLILVVFSILHEKIHARVLFFLYSLCPLPYSHLPNNSSEQASFLREMLVPANFMAGTFQIVRIKPLVAVTQLPQNANRKQWLDKIKMEARKENRIILLISQSVLSCPSSSTGYVEGPYSIALLGDFCTTFLASSFFLLLSYVILCT